MRNESDENFLRTVSEAVDYSSEEVLEFASKQGNREKTVRVAEYEKARMETAFNPDIRDKISAVFEDLNSCLSPEARELQQRKGEQFREKLERVVKRLGNETFEFPYVGELFMSADEINQGTTDGAFPGVIEAGRPDLVLPNQISRKDLIQLASFKYMIDATGVDHIVSGYVKAIIDFYKHDKIPRPTDIHFILRDGRVPHAATAGFSIQDPDFLPPELKGRVKASYINSAMAEPLVQDSQTNAPSMIYTRNEKAITKEEAIAFFEQLGILGQTGQAFILLADTASMGTIPITLDKARQETGDLFRMAMITMAGGWQGNPLIPNYTRYLASGKWLASPEYEDPIILKKCEIVHTYAENNFAGYTKRPESLHSKIRGGKKKLLPPIQPFNDSTSILSWTSLQAAKDTGEIHGLMSRTNDSVLDIMPSRALDYLWSMWTHTVGPNPIMPNVAFCPFMTEHSGKDGIMARWHDEILEKIDWDTI